MKNFILAQNRCDSPLIGARTHTLISNRDRKVAANEAAAKKLGEDIRTRNLGKELIGSRIKMECWDSMEVQKKEVSQTAGGNT